MPPSKPQLPQTGQRFASSAGPVNRRTVRQPVEAAPPPQAHASLRQRMAQVQARHRLGQPLSQRLAVGRGNRHRGATPAASVGAAGALGGVGLLLASWLYASWLLGAGAVGLLGVAAGLWIKARQQSAATSLAAQPLQPLFDASALAKLDEVLHHLASEMTEAQLAPLRSLADTLERMAPLMRRVGMNEQFTQEDHFYVTECVRRYLPDTLQAYLQVPRHSRALAASTAPTDVGSAESTSADALLAAQLALLQTELARREQALNSASTEALQKQQRFLQAKGATGKV
jgi:hypothetical protein